MIQKILRTALLSAGLILAAQATFAAQITYTETGDAGDIVTAAPQLVTGNAGDTVTAIKGTLTSSAGISEGDAFKIYISSPSTFSATTTGFTPGYNGFDSQLFLFTLSGFGIVANDDDSATGAEQSTISAGNSFTSALTAGYYYLLITGSGKSPSSAGGLIFPSFSDGTTDPTGLYGPTGPGGNAPISGFAGSSNSGGDYLIKLTGVSIAAAAVPEPSSLCLGLAGGLALIALRRRQARNNARDEFAAR